MMQQYTQTLLMIEPVAFGFNPETAKNNYFQKSTGEAQENALKEFKAMVATLRAAGVNVLVVKDTPNPHTPDSIFPNNWISFHEEGKIALYPMNAHNRRLERKQTVIDALDKEGFMLDEIIDYTEAEKENVFLEGTGSMILDRENKVAYGALSERTDEALFIEFCEDFEYLPIVFHSFQTVNGKRLPIYHTNVMMCIADKYAIICLDSIDDKKEKNVLVKILKQTQKEIITITEKQLHNFAGNMLQVKAGNEPALVMSQTAYNSLDKQQIEKIESFNKIITVQIPTIEKNGEAAQDV